MAAGQRRTGADGMTAIDPAEDHTEAITLGLHDASPPHLVDAMAKDVELELGWGQLISAKHLPMSTR